MPRAPGFTWTLAPPCRCDDGRGRNAPPPASAVAPRSQAAGKGAAQAARPSHLCELAFWSSGRRTR